MHAFFSVTLFTFLFCSPIFAQNENNNATTNAEQIALDEAAVKNTVEQETIDFSLMSFAEVARKHWILDEKSYMCVTHSDGYTNIQRKEELLARDQAVPQDQVTTEKTNFSVVLNGNMATAYHHQVVTFVETGDKLFTHEIRILEKVEGVWKIHCSSIHQYTPRY